MTDNKGALHRTLQGSLVHEEGDSGERGSFVEMHGYATAVRSTFRRTWAGVCSSDSTCETDRDSISISFRTSLTQWIAHLLDCIQFATIENPFLSQLTCTSETSMNDDGSPIYKVWRIPVGES